jgi:hypothetical protein
MIEHIKQYEYTKNPYTPLLIIPTYEAKYRDSS